VKVSLTWIEKVPHIAFPNFSSYVFYREVVNTLSGIYYLPANYLLSKN